MKVHAKNGKYDCVMEVIKRLTCITINFKNYFYENESCTIRYFGVISDFVLYKDSGILKINFCDMYINKQKNIMLNKQINFKKYKNCIINS